MFPFYRWDTEALRETAKDHLAPAELGSKPCLPSSPNLLSFHHLSPRLSTNPRLPLPLFLPDARFARKRGQPQNGRDVPSVTLGRSPAERKWSGPGLQTPEGTVSLGKGHNPVPCHVLSGGFGPQSRMTLRMHQEEAQRKLTFWTCFCCF